MLRQARDVPGTKELFGSERAKIAKRLGHQNAKKAAEHIGAGRLDLAADLALAYYDKTYSQSIIKKQSQVLIKIDITGCNHSQAAIKILDQTKEL
jgi:hypothetical protein